MQLVSPTVRYRNMESELFKRANWFLFFPLPFTLSHPGKYVSFYFRHEKLLVNHKAWVSESNLDLIVFAFITGNSNLEPLLEGLLAQIHMDLSSRGFGRNRSGDLRITHISDRCHALIH